MDMLGRIGLCVRKTAVAGWMLCPALTAAASALSITLSPGTFDDHIAGIEAVKPSSLVIEGSCDVRDMKLIAECLPQSVDTLDMSALYIAEYAYPFNSTEERGVYGQGELPPYLFAFSRFRSVSLPANTAFLPEGLFASSGIEEISLGSGIKSIGEYAFFCCSSLRKVEFSWGLERMGTGSFEGCVALEEMDLSQTAVRDFPGRFLAGCTSLTAVKLPGIIKSVGTEAFANTSLGSVSVTWETECGDFALSSMPELQSVSLDGAKSSKGLLFNNPKLSQGAITEGAYAPLYLAGASSVSDPRILVSATVLGEYSLAGISVDSLVLGAGLVEIKGNALYGINRLRLINATALKGMLPEVTEESFYGINPSEIRLGVDGDHIDAWKAHPQWSRFDLFVGNSGVDDVDDDIQGSTVLISASGKTISVKAFSPLVSVALYSAGGTLLYAASPGMAETEIDASSWGQSVVIADASDSAGNRKSIKIVID